MKKLLFLTIIISLFFACNQKEKLYDEVMDVHDHAMAKMDKIMSLKSELKEKIQTLEMDTTTDHSDEINEMNGLLQDLNASDESMMNWMREFHSNYETQSRDEVMDYLENQKRLIEQIGNNMNDVITDAEEYMEKWPLLQVFRSGILIN